MNAVSAAAPPPNVLGWTAAELAVAALYLSDHFDGVQVCAILTGSDTRNNIHSHIMGFRTTGLRCSQMPYAHLLAERFQLCEKGPSLMITHEGGRQVVVNGDDRSVVPHSHSKRLVSGDAGDLELCSQVSKLLQRYQAASSPLPNFY